MSRAPRYRICAHLPGSDYYAEPSNPGFTLWPKGVILTGITRAEARVIARALNDALKAGTLEFGRNA